MMETVRWSKMMDTGPGFGKSDTNSRQWRRRRRIFFSKKKFFFYILWFSFLLSSFTITANKQVQHHQRQRTLTQATAEFFVHGSHPVPASGDDISYGIGTDDDIDPMSLLLSDQPLLKTPGSSTSGTTTSYVVVSGQRAILNCPLLIESGKKLLPSSAASINSQSSSTGGGGTSSGPLLTIPIRWKKENTLLPYDHRQHIHPNGTLVISSAQKRADDGIYYCYFYNDHEDGRTSQNTGTDVDKDQHGKSVSIHLKVIDPPRVGPYEFPADLQVGMKARAMCSVMQGDAPFRFMWTQDGHRIESDVPTEDTGAIFRTQHFRDYSMLTVDSLTLSHAGNITCIVTNDAGRTAQSSLLKVNAPPQWLVEPQDTQVILHQSARIDCLASGSPKPFTTWKRATGVSPWEYVPIYNSAHYFLHANGSLTVKSATQAQAGPYICHSTNGYGSDIGKLIHLKVNEPPRFTVQSLTQSAYKDKPVRLVCPPEGDRPIHMEWFLLNGTLLNEIEHHRTKSNKNQKSDPALRNFMIEVKEISTKFLNEEPNIMEQDMIDSNAIDDRLDDADLDDDSASKSVVSVLTIRKPARDDSRVYVCKASNEYGWAELKIRIIVKEKPDVPEEFSILNVTESSAEMRWREPFNGNAAIVNYVVEYRPLAAASTAVPGDSNGGEENNNNSKKPAPVSPVSTVTIPADRLLVQNGSLRSATLQDLRPSTFYQARIAAQNRVGQSDFTSWIRFQTDQSAPETPPSDVTATPTGPNSVKITWKSPKKSSWNGEITGYYIGYRAEKSDTDLYKTVENSANVNGKHESHITNLHRSTVYKAWVQAFNTRGTGPRSEVVSVQTLADVPPSAPMLRLHSSTSDSITISWSSSAYGSRSSNDLTLYYRAYQPANTDHPLVPGAKIIQSNAISPTTWRDISILEPNGRHTVSGLECGRSYEFFATAHNSVGKSEPSTPLVARTRGDAPTPPPKSQFLTEAGPHGVIINLVNWKHNECPIQHFSLRIRPKSSNSALVQPWSVLSMQHNPRENFVLRKLTPNTAYEIEVTAHSSAGSTQVIHQFVTPNVTSDSYLSKAGYDSKLSIAYPSATTEISFSDYEILLPVISSLIVVVVIVAVACFLCSRDHHSLFLQPGFNARQRQQSTSSENKVPFHQQEMSILKELVRSSSVTMAGTGGEHDSMMMSNVHPDEYNCIGSEPTSIITTSEHLNHHLIGTSPRHNVLGQKKDLVELQSFFNHQQQQTGCHHQQQQSHRQSSNTGNYALPYDVLPVCGRDNGGGGTNANIYGTGRGPVLASKPQSQTVTTAPVTNPMEPLYATAKLGNFNYCQKQQEDSSDVQPLHTSSSTSSSNQSSNRANYESLVPILTNPSTR